MVETNGRNTRRRGNKCSKLLAGIMIGLAYLILITGCLLFALCVVLLFFKGKFIPLLHSNFYFYCILLTIGCGVLNLITGCLLRATFSSKCALCMYIVILLLGMTLEGGLGYFALSYRAKIPMDIESTFRNDIITNYGENYLITKAIDDIQSEGKCCGAIAFNDYPKKDDDDDGDYIVGYRPKKVQYVPDSCCKSYKIGCALSDSPSNIYYKGCLSFLKSEIGQNIDFIFIATAVSFLIHFLTLLLSCCYCIKSGDNEVEEEEQKVRFKDREQEMYLFD